MFWEYVTDTVFVVFMIIGGIVALYYVYARKANKRRAK